LAAQVDLAGYWHNPLNEDRDDRMNGPLPGDYTGIPLNDAARLKADSWDPALQTVPERQCIPHPADYGPSFSNVQLWKEFDKATHADLAWHTHFYWMAPERTIWMDGRPHPPESAPHTWQGFSTGHWDGNMLVVNTTHLKLGWIRRNGVPRSEQAAMLEYFIRDGDTLTWVTVIDDPLYLTELIVRSRDFVLNPNGIMGAYPCESVVEIQRPEGIVPSHLLGANPFLNEVSKKWGIPQEAVRGGAETLYPEYRSKLNALKSKAETK
jgi:hypothetical protein